MIKDLRIVNRPKRFRRVTFWCGKEKTARGYLAQLCTGALVVAGCWIDDLNERHEAERVLRDMLLLRYGGESAE